MLEVQEFDPENKHPRKEDSKHGHHACHDRQEAMVKSKVNLEELLHGYFTVVRVPQQCGDISEL